MGSLNALSGALVPQAAGSFASPIVSGAMSSLANWAIDSYQDNVRNEQELATERLKMAQASEEAKAKLEEMETSAKIAEEERLKNLKIAIAKQKASFGGRGVSSSSGSANAVLTGFMNDSEEEKANREKMEKIQKQAVIDSLSRSNEKSLLEMSQIKDEAGAGRGLFDLIS